MTFFRRYIYLAYNVQNICQFGSSCPRKPSPCHFQQQQQVSVHTTFLHVLVCTSDKVASAVPMISCHVSRICTVFMQGLYTDIKCAIVSTLSPRSPHNLLNVEMFSLSTWCLIALVLIACSWAAINVPHLCSPFQVATFHPVPITRFLEFSLTREYAAKASVFQFAFPTRFDGVPVSPRL